MNCRFTATNQPRQHRCARCGLVVTSSHAAERVFARCLTAEKDAVAPPTLPRRVWNLAQSLAAFVADGLRTVDKAQYAERLRICDLCPDRHGDTCGRCGCRLSLKARGRAFACPVDKWPSA